MNIKPLGNRVVLKQAKVEEKTSSGIILTGNAQEKPQYLEVVAVGPGINDANGNKIPVEVSVGQKVIWQKYSGSTVKMDDEEYTIINAEDILAIIE